MHGAVVTEGLLLMQACGFDQSGDLPRMMRCSGRTEHH